MCETAEVRGGKGRQAISALYLCQQSQTDLLTPDDDDDDDDDQCNLLVLTIANIHYLLLPPIFHQEFMVLHAWAQLFLSIFQIKSRQVFKSLPCLV